MDNSCAGPAAARAGAGGRGRWALAALVMTAGSSMGLAQPLGPESAAPVPARDPLKSDRGQPPQGPLASDSSLEAYESRPVRGVTINGLKRIPADLVNNQVRTRAGTPLSAVLVREDVQRLNRLDRFREINARVQPFEDGSVGLIFDLVESPVVRDVQAVGNRQISDADISAEVHLLEDRSVDEFQIGAAINRIQRLYRDKGYYQATVTVDQKELDERGIVLFRINEGDRVKVKDIRFEGNAAFTPRQLSPGIKSRTAGLFESGPVDNEVLDKDVAGLVEFYKDRGYLDIRADRRITFAPSGKEAIVTFLLDEGRLYTLRSVKVSVMDSAGGPVRPPVSADPKIFSREQIAGLLTIKAGDVYSADKIRASVDLVRNAYARMGFAEARVTRAELRDETRPEVDLLILVREGEAFRTGLTPIAGNELTRLDVILPETDNLRPDRPLDTSTRRVGAGESSRQVLEVEDRLNGLRLFEPGSVRVTVQPEDPANPGYRDALLELRETNTGSLGFGAGLSSDAGVIGQIRLNQRNFDASDTPDSFGELISGRAFRGGGQEFTLDLSPGTEVQQYTLSLTDPTVFGSDYSAGGSVFYRTRQYDEYDENRAGVQASVGRRFGTRWTGNLTLRYNNVDISDIDDEMNATADLLAVEGANDLTGLGANLTRTTVDSRFRPSKGTRVELGVERVGLLGGDFDFTRLTANHQVFFAIDEDFFGRRTVLSFRTEAGYIPEGQDDTPLFERFYSGGRSFRGFRFRTVSPKGDTEDGRPTTDPVGGTFSFFFGTELERPLVDDFLAGLVFIDTGTVDEDVSFDKYRASVGFGLRMYIEALSPAPLAFDFGFPLIKYYGDEERVFSFSVDIPF